MRYDHYMGRQASKDQLRASEFPSGEANTSSGRQHILRNSWITKVHYRINKITLHVHVLSQITPVRAPPSFLFKIHFNIIPSSTSKSSDWFLSFRFLHQNHITSLGSCDCASSAKYEDRKTNKMHQLEVYY